VLNTRLTDYANQTKNLQLDIAKNDQVIKDLSYYKGISEKFAYENDVKNARIESLNNQILELKEQQMHQLPPSKQLIQRGTNFDQNYYIQEINKQRRQIHSLNSELNQYRYT
ncbi:hypothetical protein, partial [Salmonella sp. s54836]|uniref:hypothetical protein n=1 Tax=Salmonella sp. s54836 TaxID=3159673 RepID=UPI00397EB6FC